MLNTFKYRSEICWITLVLSLCLSPQPPQDNFSFLVQIPLKTK